MKIDKWNTQNSEFCTKQNKFRFNEEKKEECVKLT